MKTRTEDEFLEGASEWLPSLSRRDFLELAGASLALAGLSGCTRPPHDPIFPYVTRPEDSVPGRPDFFATACVLNGLATGILIETHEGRPTKIEGNPDHPASLGSALAWQQARILGLYDPDRAQDVLFQKKKSTWADFQKTWQSQSEKLSQTGGKGFVILSEPTSSPTLLNQMKALKAKFPFLRWIQWSPLVTNSSREASQQNFGNDLSPLYDFKQADVVVSFDSDFLAGFDFPVSSSRHFMQKRRQADQGKTSNYLFMAECGLSLTGLKANRRLALSSSELQNFAKDLFAAVSSTGSSTEVDRLAKRIRENSGRCVFLAGSQQPTEVHSICQLLNLRFGDKVVSWIQNPIPSQDSDLNSLAQDLEQNKVQALVILGSNPVATSALGQKWTSLIRKSEFQVHLSDHEVETSDACDWFLPMSDDFESWSDSRAFDGSVTILQPSIRPLYETKDGHELLHFLSDLEQKTSFEIVQTYWKTIWGDKFPELWQRSLRKGFVEKSAFALQKPHAKSSFKPLARVPENSSALELCLKPDPFLLDGRFANNAWLQELPDPLTKITWDNVAMISEELAHQKKIVSGQVVEIQVGEKKLKVPAWVAKGLPKNSVLLNLGYGRTRCGKVGTNVGVDGFRLKNLETSFFIPIQLSATSETVELACAQTHQKMEERSPVKSTKDLKPAKAAVSLYPASPVSDFFEKEAWAMVIDLDSCIGCAACVVACQSENNIPVVGKRGVLSGREMHWIRVDRYDAGNFQPVPCMHCEKAPCEPVCPAGATVHGDGGLNQMIYNRCVGTRYCSSNCPYKVRRFNFLNYTRFSELEKLQKNPDVTIRSRGVMEKCTYCVQRINQSRIQAKVQERTLKDGELQTACQQTCPTQAIVFGNQNDVTSQVRSLKSSPRHYSLLEELGTRPRTTYLAKLPDEGTNG